MTAQAPWFSHVGAAPAPAPRSAPAQAAPRLFVEVRVPLLPAPEVFEEVQLEARVVAKVEELARVAADAVAREPGVKVEVDDGRRAGGEDFLGRVEHGEDVALGVGAQHGDVGGREAVAGGRVARARAVLARWDSLQAPLRVRDDAARFGMVAEIAEAEGKWKRVSLTQVQLCSYFTGYSEIYDFREELKKNEGKSFNLKNFHEKFLSYGSAPVKYIKELMVVKE